jgi:hypothetical protein
MRQEKQITKNFYRHFVTGEIFCIEHRWDIFTPPFSSIAYKDLHIFFGFHPFVVPAPLY